MLTTKITNEEKYSKVSEVEFSANSIYKGAFDGHVYIQLENGAEINADGDHGVRDYEEDFGFIVIEE